MSALHDLQNALAAAILSGSPPPEHQLRHPRLDPAAVLAIHRRNFVTSLREALAATFPAIVRVVGDGFFAYAAHEFVRRHPPISPCLADCGREFPLFLAEFAPCAHLAYLADCARLEWLLHEAARAPAVPPLGRDALALAPGNGVDRLRFRLDPTLRFLAAGWPIDTIVALARDDGDAGWIALEPCELFFQIRRVGREARSTRLTRATFAFRTALADGTSLEGAFDQASLADPDFDLAGALAGLIDEGVVVGLASDPATEEPS